VGMGPRPMRTGLEPFGQEMDARPFVYALSNVTTASAGLSRLPDSAAPGDDIRPGSPVRAIRIAGDCMEPLLSDGDVALVLPAENVRDGNAVLVLLDGGTTGCKRIRITPESCWLESESGERIEEPRFMTIGVVAHKITRV
jgi:phage repressor protein C with HTH and peptisase S24 domain